MSFKCYILIFTLSKISNCHLNHKIGSIVFFKKVTRNEPIYPQNCIKCWDCYETNQVCLNKICVCERNFQND
jgi:hypothetical protein